MKSKEVQIIPWVIGDSNYVRSPSQRLDPQNTVFVGALHGMLNAEGLAHIFNDLFGGVVYAGIDTDKHKYPIGSGRVTFNNTKSYMKSVAAAFIEIKAQKFNKKVQVDPYLEDALCSACKLKQVTSLRQYPSTLFVSKYRPERGIIRFFPYRSDIFLNYLIRVLASPPENILQP